MNRVLNRRHFLQTSAALLAASAFAEETSKKRHIKKAVNLGMVKAEGASTEDKFRMIKDAGFEGVEINRPDALPLEEIIKAREATGLEISGIICSTHWDKPLSHNDPAIREQGMRGMKLALNDAQEMGCERILLVPGVVNADTNYADAYERSLSKIRELAPLAEKAKCKIAVENVWNNFLLSPLEAARFIDEINSPWVGWHFDIGNVVKTGWPEQWIRILGKRIMNLHIKEFSHKNGFNSLLGEGDVRWPEVSKALEEIQFEGWGILEVGGGDAAHLKFLAERSNSLLA